VLVFVLVAVLVSALLLALTPMIRAIEKGRSTGCGLLWKMRTRKGAPGLVGED